MFQGRSWESTAPICIPLRDLFLKDMETTIMSSPLGLPVYTAEEHSLGRLQTTWDNEPQGRSHSSTFRLRLCGDGTAPRSTMPMKTLKTLGSEKRNYSESRRASTLNLGFASSMGNASMLIRHAFRFTDDGDFGWPT